MKQANNKNKVKKFTASANESGILFNFMHPRPTELQLFYFLAIIVFTALFEPTSSDSLQHEPQLNISLLFIFPLYILIYFIVSKKEMIIPIKLGATLFYYFLILCLSIFAFKEYNSIGTVEPSYPYLVNQFVLLGSAAIALIRIILLYIPKQINGNLSALTSGFDKQYKKTAFIIFGLGCGVVTYYFTNSVPGGLTVIGLSYAYISASEIILNPITDRLLVINYTKNRQ